MNTDEAGKVLKPTNDNPFIVSSQQPNVVDMRGNNLFDPSMLWSLPSLPYSYSTTIFKI